MNLAGRLWPTVEHYYQAQKFSDTLYQDAIFRAATPKIAATMGRNPAWPLRCEWESIKEQVMYEALVAKFIKHREIRLILLNTGDDLIIEASPYDSYWGEGADGRGSNRLGILLMKVRQLLRAEVVSEDVEC